MRRWGIADGQPDGPVAEIGYEVQPAAEGLNVAGDDLEGGDLAVLDLGYPGATLTPWRRRSASGQPLSLQLNGTSGHTTPAFVGLRCGTPVVTFPCLLRR
jgi:hypothetical protein